MSWWDSLTSGLGSLWGGIKDVGGSVGDYLSSNKDLSNALVAGGVSLYDAYNKNQANKKVSSALQAAESASASDAEDYQNYLNVLAQWQAANPSSGSSGGGGYSYGARHPYAGYVAQLTKELEPYTKMNLKNARAGSKAYRKALKDLAKEDLTIEVAPAYSIETGMGDMIKKAKKKDGAE